MNKNLIILGIGLIICFSMFLNQPAFALSKSKLVDYYLFNNTNNQALDYCNHTVSPDCLTPDRIAMSVNNNCQLPGIIDQSCGYYRNGMGGTFLSNTQMKWLTDNTTSYTVNAWVNLNGTGGAGAHDFLITTTGQAITGRFDIRVDNFDGSNDRVDWVLRTATNSFTISSPTHSIFANNKWYMLTFTLNNSPSTINNAKLYINATLIAQGNVTGLDGTGDMTDLGFGACCVDSGPAWNQPLAGRADEFSLWQRLLSPSEITSLFNSGNGLSLIAGASPSFTNSVSPTVSSTTVVLPAGYVSNNNVNGVCLSQELLTFNNVLKQTATFTPHFCFIDGQYTVPYAFNQPSLGNGTYRIIPTFDGSVNCLNGDNCISSVKIGTDSKGNITIGNSTSNGNQTNYASPTLAYNFHRTPDYSKLIGSILISPTPFDLSCKVLNGTFLQSSKWFTFHQVNFANITANVPITDTAYFVCYHTSNSTILFSGSSPGNGSMIKQGAQVFNNSFGAIIGIPAGMFVIVLIASLANQRTGPIYVIATLAVAGILATIGYFTLDTGYWALSLICGMLGLLVGRKIF